LDSVSAVVFDNRFLIIPWLIFNGLSIVIGFLAIFATLFTAGVLFPGMALSKISGQGDLGPMICF
jgi:hypothetical protein